MKKIIWVFLLAVFFQNSAFCSCLGPSGDDDLVIQFNYAIYDSVFTGKVIDIKVRNGDEAIIIFQVLKQFKGATNEKNEIFGEGCLYSKKPRVFEDSFTFSIGKTYLVYANNFKGKLHVSGCSRTRLLAEGDKDIQALEKIITTPGWSFDKEKISEFEKNFILPPYLKEILIKKNGSSE